VSVAKPSLLAAASLAQYTHNPLGFVMSQYPWGQGSLRNEDGPRPWQKEVLLRVGDHLSNPKTRFTPLQIAISSGHGIGKSALISWLVQWGVGTFEDCRGIVTANTEGQLRTKTWPEMAKWSNMMAARDFFRLEGTTFKARHFEKTWRVDAIPWSETNPEAFSGLHNKGKRLLILFDEASAIHEKIWEAIAGALTDAGTEIIFICFGNPTRPKGNFFDCFNRMRHRWWHRQIDSRTVPGTNTALYAEWEEDYGEDSDFFRVRVRGVFPRSGSDQLIPYALVTAAQQRDDVSPRISDPLIFGLDVARFGDDKSVLWPRKGRVAGIHGGPWDWRGLGNVELAERVTKKIIELKPHVVNIDGGGPGGGVIDTLRAWGYTVNEVQFGAKAFDSDYANRRAEMWCTGKKWLEEGGSIPHWANDLANDLTNQTYSYKEDGTQALILTPKKVMKSDGYPSPDEGDAFMLTHAIPVHPITDVSRGLGDVTSAITEYPGGWE